MKLENLFPVQKQVIPIILNSNRNQSIYPNDICVTAPTGSGKTLTYVLPLIQNLKNRIRPCCRAIVLVPVSDLAEQVYEVFRSCLNSSNENLNLLKENFNVNETQSNDLKVILLTNKNPFNKEQAHLVSEEHGKCLKDIVVATPGRLVDHIQKTNGFDLTDLRYLILDECDRIMDQIKQNWLPILNQAVLSNYSDKKNRDLLNQESLNAHNLFLNKNKLLSYQKILLSATLTRNPEKLDQINLFQPLYFSVAAEKLKMPDGEKFDSIKKTVSNIKEEAKLNNSEKTSALLSKDQTDLSVPEELKEVFIQVVSMQKPLIAIYLLKTLGYRRMLCFVKSKETASRLNKLFKLNNIKSMEYTSALQSSRRKKAQSKFEKNSLDVLVCSDVMARGMDLENVDYVLLYDSCKDLNSYIHKVGRTARAGRSGTAISLLEQKEIYFFKKMTLKIGNQEAPNKNKHKIKEIKIKRSQLKPLLEEYRSSLTKLRETIEIKSNAQSENLNQETSVKDEIENKNSTESKREGKRKHLKERGKKFLSRLKRFK